eukprot:167189-Rhodomonas_salina.1
MRAVESSLAVKSRVIGCGPHVRYLSTGHRVARHSLIAEFSTGQPHAAMSVPDIAERARRLVA